MENTYNNFIQYNISKKNDILIFLFDVKKEHPTAFEWTCAVEDFKQRMIEIQNININFVYVLDVRLMGLLTIAQIKEFSKLLQTYGPFLEKKLICSTVIADGSIIKNIFELVKMFYKTVKPLKIVNNMDNGDKFIEECKLNFK
jgi:hypothetical protein